MEEKNVTKISLSTFFLILAIIAIIVMGIFIYKLNNEKTTEIQKSTELQSQVNSLNGTINDLQGKITTISETINANSSNENYSSTKNSIEYQISGTYYQKNAQGDEPNFTFSANNKVTYGALWTCSGTYTINNNTIKINFTSAVDPDGNKANVKDYGVKESVELTIIDDNNLKDNSDGITYSKKLNTVVSKNTSAEALYVYSSGDNAAAKGNPELLYVYEFSNNKMKFKYHTPWNNEDIEGVAKSTNGEKYIYENSNRKLEISLNSMGENSVKVTEYENNSMTSYKNLFK